MGSVPEWTTLDSNPHCSPDYVFDLNEICKGNRLPFRDNQFDEIHCYNGMMMWGDQGDWRGWFNEWGEYWRVLKSRGIFCATVPDASGEWAWADPGCRRVVHPINLKYLTREFYEHKQLPLTNYFNDVKGWWKIIQESKKESSGAYLFLMEKSE
jgi:SAM-dependent methyltransferase